MAPRIPPGSSRDIGRLNMLIARALGAATGGPPPHLFTTISRHRRLYRRWLRFAAALMPGGVLPRDESELLILRVAHNCGCEYEWRHHRQIGLTAGLTAEEIAAVRDGAAAAVFGERRRRLLRAADELHERRDLSDELWDELRPLMSDAELIELCMLVGHYEMLAMTLNALRVEPDEVAPGNRPPRAMRALRSLTERRASSSTHRASPLEPFLRLTDRSWRVLAPLMRGHAMIYRATGGRLGKSLPGVPPMLLLDHVGARSGKLRTTPLVYMPDGDRLIVVAAKGGHPENPAWLHNLRAHPDTEIQIGSRRIGVHAREADDDERRTLWPRALAYTAHWRRYDRRSPRTIPVLILEPARG